MNERFIRCSECGMPHEEGLRTCPSTGRPIARASPPAGGRTSPSVRPGSAFPPPFGSAASAAPPQAPPSPRGPSASRAGRDSIDFDLIGTLIGGKYRVRDTLGQGGMGTVFEAVHEALGNVVAIKVLHPNQVQKKDAVQRFHHEARAAARIGHPNICEVHDVGALADGRPYLVMEKLTGATLAERIQSLGGLPFQEVLDTLTQVLSGLHAAHDKGIIHRDVKPENVFLSQRIGCPPVAKILDFGVSKVMSHHAQASGFGDVEVTRTGVVLGTPYYLSPEQARGERTLDARVDLYACGVMLYEALTGRRPFRAANYNALLIAILMSTPRPAREIRPDLPPGFGRILDKALEREPDDRYQTALDFQEALQPYSQNPVTRRRADDPPPRPTTHPPPAPGSAEDLQAFLESASSDVLAAPPPLPPPPPPLPPPTPPPPPPPAASLAPRDPVVPRATRRLVPPAPEPPPRAAPRPSAIPSPPSVRPRSSLLSAPPPAAAPSPSSMTAPPSPKTPPPPPRRPASVSPPAPRVHPAPRKNPGTFDDQATEIDLPRAFPDHSPPKPSRSTSTKPRGVDAFAPRRNAPIMGPPLRPAEGPGFADETATEIMSGAVRSHLSERPKEGEAALPPVPPRPNPPRR